MAPNKLKKAAKSGKKYLNSSQGEGQSSQTPTAAKTSISQGERDAPAATSQGDPAQVTVAYRFDIHQISPRGSSLHSTSIPTTPTGRSSMSIRSFSSEINLTTLPPKLRQSASSKYSLCQDLAEQVRELKRKPSNTSSIDGEQKRTHQKELELLEAQHDFLNLQMYLAEKEADKSGKALEKDTTYADLCQMRDLVSRTIMNSRNSLNKAALMTEAEVAQMKADMDRLGLAYALSIADQYKQYDQIPDWLSRSGDAQADFKKRLIADYPELERTSNSGKKQYWCPVTKRWFAQGYMRAAHLVPHHWGYNQVGCIFGEPNNGYSHVWSTRNGLHVQILVEMAFDKGQIVIVPDDGQRWKVQVVDKSLLEPADDDDDDRDGGGWQTGLPWRIYNNTELDFRGALSRPGRRYLYAHYITTLLLTYRLKKPGWQLMVEERRERRVWATPGKWYRESTLKHLARFVADEADAAELFVESISPDAPDVSKDLGESLSLAIAHEDSEAIEEAMINLHETPPAPEFNY